MKLDKIKFAQLISYISHITGSTLASDEVAAIDATIDIEAPEPIEQQAIYPKNENVERLMMFMAEGTKKIEAIKEHRVITGMGLKESKDAVERYWKADKSNSYTYSELHQKLKDIDANTAEYITIQNFLSKL